MSDETLDFLGGLDDTPAPPPKPNPATPNPPSLGHVVSAPASSFVRILEFAGIALITAALTAGFVAWRLGGRGDGPKPSADAVALGRSFTPILAGTLADGFDAGRPKLKVGESLAPAIAALKATFEANRNAAFDKHAGDAIHAIVADGKPIENDAQLRAVDTLFADISKGLRASK